MSWVNLFNVPSTPESFATFSFENQSHHRNLNGYLASNGIAVSTDYVLDPIPTYALNEWLWRHQQVHNLMNAGLGLIGDDLTRVDFKDVDSLTSWIELHASEHRDAAQQSGVS